MLPRLLSSSSNNTPRSCTPRSPPQRCSNPTTPSYWHNHTLLPPNRSTQLSVQLWQSHPRRRIIIRTSLWQQQQATPPPPCQRSTTITMHTHSIINSSLLRTTSPRTIKPTNTTTSSINSSSSKWCFSSRQPRRLQRPAPPHHYNPPCTWHQQHPQLLPRLLRLPSTILLPWCTTHHSSCRSGCREQ